MNPRIDYKEESPGAFQATRGMQGYVRCGLEHSLLELV